MFLWHFEKWICLPSTSLHHFSSNDPSFPNVLEVESNSRLKTLQQQRHVQATGVVSVSDFKTILDNIMKQSYLI